VAICLYPVMPGTAEEILDRLGQPHEPDDLLLENAVWEQAAPASVRVAPPLFPRIESPE
jgi:methionyl-tRNA synthetase